ncbi:MAG: hypothetical protein LBP99_08045 [Azoarcus sp.]|jgi:prophage tail gpP-like protein|nr:hypothetical protein [Azoarcus sp.]
MDDGQVEIRFNGIRYGHWKSAEVRASVDDLCASLRLDVTWPGAGDSLDITANTVIDVLIAGQVAYKMRIDSLSRSVGKESHDISIEGRTLARELIDSQYSKTLSGLTLGEIAKHLCADFKVPLKLAAATKEVPEFSMQCESPATSLINAARTANLLFYPTADGGLILTEPTKAAPVASLIYGENVLSYEVVDEYALRFSEYCVKGYDYDEDEAISGKSRDKGISFYRPMHIVADKHGHGFGGCERRAELERNRRLARAHRIVLTVQGWRYPAGNNWNLWDINTQARVTIPHEDVDDVFLIGEAIYTGGDSDDEKVAAEAAAEAFYLENKKAMDTGADVSWPQVRPLYRLMCLRAVDHDAFNQEYQNESGNDDKAPFRTIHIWTDRRSDWIFFGAIDPSLGKRGARHDPSAILVGGLLRETMTLDVVEADICRRVPDLIIERAIELQRESAHDRAFVVAGAMKADLINDLHRAVEDNIKAGKSVDDFRRDFAGIVDRHGWHGWTGEGTEKGEAWRTRVIFETNLRTSYAAGRYAQLKDPGLLNRRPYWQYVHSGHEHYRPEHKAWGDSGLTLRHDNPFWQTHYPPNGWGCGCSVRAVPAPADGAATEPPAGWDTPDPKTGVPPGIDKGWGYAPGARTDVSMRQFVQEKLISYPPAIQRALVKDIGKKLCATERIEDYVAAVMADASRTDDLWLGFIEQPERFATAVKTDLTGFIVLLPPDAVRHEVKAHGHDGGSQRPVLAEDYKRLVDGLNRGALTLPSESWKGRDAERFVVQWEDEGEIFRGVFGVRPGRHNRSVVLVSMIVKTAKKK